MTGDSERLPIDELLDAISDPRRRHAIAYMQCSEEDVFQLEDIARAITTRETGLSAASAEDREQVQIALHHNHVPKLDAAGFIEYDSRSGDVRYRGVPDSDVVDTSKLREIVENLAANVDR